MTRYACFLLLLMAVVSGGCSDNRSAYDRDEYAAEAAGDAAAAAADAAAAAADAASGAAQGGDAAALPQMGVDHLVSDMLVGLPEANYSRVAFRPAEQRPDNRSSTAEQAMLAYEHEVEVLTDADSIAAKVKAAKQACETAKFGACLVLRVDQRGGRYARASLRVRAEAKVIEPLIAAAGQGGDLGDRSTRAEDLAVAVRDNTLLQSRLDKQHARLLQFQDRSDLKVADVIALSEQLSKVEAELEAAQCEGAVHKRRIETQLLTIRFMPNVGESGRSEIAMAFADSGHVMASSSAGVIRVVAGLLPVLLALALAIWLLRRLVGFLRRAKPPKKA